MGLGTGMSRGLLNIVPRAYVTLFLDKGFLNVCLLRILMKVLVRMFVPHVLQHHVRHGSDSFKMKANS